MHEAGVLTDILKSLGINALIFVILRSYHHSQVATFKQILDENFKVMRGLLESVHYQSSLLAKISEQINANQYCPLMRKEYKRLSNNELREC